VVTLRRGATVVVSAWYRTPDAVVTDLAIHADWQAQLPRSAWTRESDGRLSTTRFSPGPHLIWVEHESAERGRLSSAIVGFELGENDWKELEVELHAPLSLRGRLDDSVPRPILDGHVWLNLHESAGVGTSYARDREAPVAEDGTFELADLSPGRGQIIALCRGWVSRRTRVDTPEEAGIRFGHEPTPAEIEEALANAGDRAFQAQRVAVPSAEPLVVLMEPTGALEVTVEKPDGSPLAGALVHTSPNVFWIGVGSTIFPWREWSATTDALGLVRIEDLPPDDALWVQAGHAAFRMKRADRDAMPRVRIDSGQTAKLEIELERSDD
jgi:hypothetical protein